MDAAVNATKKAAPDFLSIKAAVNSHQHHHDQLKIFDNLAARFLTQDWKGQIIMPMSLGSDGPVQDYNMCEHFGLRHTPATKLYFDITNFPGPSQDILELEPKAQLQLVKKLPEYQSLTNDIQLASFNCGSPVIKNGNCSQKPKFSCSGCHRMYRPGNTDVAMVSAAASLPLRKDSIIDSDKNGRRPNGRALSRRTNTKLSLQPGHCCKFQFLISWNSHGYFLVQRAGNPMHSNHLRVDPSNIPIPTSLLPQDERDNLIALADANVGSGVGRSFIKSKLGKHISRAKVAYLQNCSQQVSDPSGSIPAGTSDIDKLLQFFEESMEISYQVLWNVPVDELTNANMEHVAGVDLLTTIPQILLSTCHDRETRESQIVDHTGDDDFADIQASAMIQRDSAAVDPFSKLFICVAWANIEELRLFKRYPSVLYCDSTGDSNNSGNHLLTFSGRTPQGQQFLFLRIWIHNQKQVTFKWVFKAALKEFISSDTFKKVNLVLVDADRQQEIEIRNMLPIHMPNATLGFCGFHVVNQNWNANGLGPMSIKDPDKEEYKAFVKILHTWLYSFMRPGYCESEEEYDISKALLFAFIDSATTLRILETHDNQDRVKTWVVNNVLKVDGRFLYYLRKGARTFWQATTSPHEGTNFGLKVHAAAVKPCHTMTKAGKALSFQGTLKVGHLNELATTALTTSSLWSLLPTANHVVAMANSLLGQIMESLDQYSVARTSFSKWQVSYSLGNNNMDESDNDDATTNNPPPSQEEQSRKFLIPRFQRIREVIMNVDGCLHCSCYHFESVGLPCAHQAAVISSCYENWKGFTHHDLALCWWKIWQSHAYNPESKDISSVLLKLERTEVTGPSFPSDDRLPPPCDVTQYKARQDILPALERVKNYTKVELERLIPPSGIHLKNGSVLYPYNGGTQQSYMLDSEDDGGQSIGSCDIFDSRLFSEREDNRKVGSRETLKHDLNELYGVLDRQKDPTLLNEVQAALASFVDQGRKKIREENQDKRKLPPGATVNIRSEQEPNSKRRTYHSKNC